MKVWGFFYCDNTWESAASLVSLHTTKAGATAAMKAHRAEEKAKFDAMWKGKRPGFKFGEFEEWSVWDVEILTP